jgi:hypothetical protein
MRKTMKRKSVYFVLVLFAFFVGVRVMAQSPEPNSAKVKPLMQKKLDHAKAILEGVAVEDYDKVARSARSLRLLSLESGWNVYQTEEYMTKSQEFRQAATSIAEAADAKNVNLAALAYVGLTIRCVDCHSYMRGNPLQPSNL